MIHHIARKNPRDIVPERQECISGETLGLQHHGCSFSALPVRDDNYASSKQLRLILTKSNIASG